MRNIDLQPLYRATVGFDQIADLMDRVFANDVSRESYPPYNIEKTADDGWRISVAVAGFSAGDLSVETRDNALLISGPSKTADIEQTLAYGVHGPRELVVIVRHAGEPPKATR